MKKTLAICIFFLGMTVQAQTDFFKFIESVKWNSTENDILRDYSSTIKERKHFYSKSDKTVTDWQIDNIKLENYIFSVSFSVDSISKKLVSLAFNIPKELIKNENAKQLSFRIDALLIDKYGIPDVEKDDEGAYMTVYNRTWYKETFILDIVHMVFKDSQLYTINAKGINSKEPDFRVAKWGDSKETIMTMEGKADKALINNLYLFDDYVAGMNCDVAYIFTDNKLSMAKYIFKMEHTNKNDYIKDFNKLISLMSEKYGDPNWNAPEWKNSLYKDNYEDYGFAISLGHLTYSAGWLNDKDDITVSLHGENYKITLLVQYVSKKYAPLKEKEDRNQDIKKL